jgi:hypothetical protein
MVERGSEAVDVSAQVDVAPSLRLLGADVERVYDLKFTEPNTFL